MGSEKPGDPGRSAEKRPPMQLLRLRLHTQEATQDPVTGGNETKQNW